MSIKYEVKVLENRRIAYYRHGVLHRVNKPAKIYRGEIHDNGHYHWIEYGRFHRIGGPSIFLGYYIRGKRYTKKLYYAKISS